MVIAVFALGGMVGGLIGGPLSDRLGRVPLMVWNNLFFVAGSVLLGTATSEVMLIAGRLLVGIGSGVATIVVPTYIGEVTPPSLRGTLGVLTQLSIVVGILVAQALSLFMSEPALWRWLLSLGGFLAIVQMVCLAVVVESPRFLLLRGRTDAAEAALRRLYGRYDVSDELASMQQGITTTTGTYTVAQLVRDSALRRPVLIVVGLLVAQQVCP
jgi:MFS family permease